MLFGNRAKSNILSLKSEQKALCHMYNKEYAYQSQGLEWIEDAFQSWDELYFCEGSFHFP